MEEEIWKEIDGYLGLYQVSNLGNVRSLKGSEPRLLKLQVGPSGKYLTIMLFHFGKKKTYLVHRLVAQAFVENPKNVFSVDHIDKDKRNNRADNLQWIEHVYNVRRSIGWTYTALNKTTGETLIAHSRRELAEMLKVSYGQILYRYNTNPHKPLKNGWFISINKTSTPAGGYK